MKLIKTEGKNKCELGSCRNPATHVIKLDRLGIKSTVFACDECLEKLYRAIGQIKIPKSYETAKPKKQDD